MILKFTGRAPSMCAALGRVVAPSARRTRPDKIRIPIRGNHSAGSPRPCYRPCIRSMFSAFLETAARTSTSKRARISTKTACISVPASTRTPAVWHKFKVAAVRYRSRVVFDFEEPGGSECDRLKALRRELLKPGLSSTSQDNPASESAQS